MSSAANIRRAGLIERVSVLTRQLYDWVLHWADTPYAMTALAVLAFAEASFFPMPPDVLLIAMALGAPRRSLRFAATCSIASVLGGLVGYGMGAFAWGHLAQLFYAYVPGFSPEGFARVQEWYEQWGLALVFLAGFSPLPYKVFTIFSGVMGLPIGLFVLGSVTSRSARFFLVAGLIYVWGDKVKRFIDRYFNWLVLAFSVLLFGGFAVVKWLV